MNESAYCFGFLPSQTTPSNSLLLRIVSFDRVLGRTDTRTEALQWLEDLHAPKQEVFAFGLAGLDAGGRHCIGADRGAEGESVDLRRILRQG